MTATVRTPAGYAPQVALAFGATDSIAVPVAYGSPLPIQPDLAAARSTPISGNGGTGSSPVFTPNLARAIWVRLSGSWVGTVTLERSTDGTNWYGLTRGDGTAKAVWTGNVNAPVTEESVAGATYRLNIALTSGTVSYEVRQ